MKTILFFLFLFHVLFVTAQTDVEFRVMWYNVENLFDTKDNPDTKDNDFLPTGSRYWTNKRYRHKLQQIAKVINAAGEWSSPALIGLCEVENDSVLTHLLTHTPLEHQLYRYCLTQGSDPRGIQVALLYQQNKFAYIEHTSYPVLSADLFQPTRDILHVSGKIANGDTLDVLLCHFPSRFGGGKKSEPARINAARTVRHLYDSLYQQRKKPQLLIMGDFNDTPTNYSIRKALNTRPLLVSKSGKTTYKDPTVLINLFANRKLSFPGSHKYQNKWFLIDQIIVSPNLTEPSHTMRLKPESIRLFTPSFLTVPDETHNGLRPKRTFWNGNYEEGYSDHFPLLTDWVIKRQKNKNEE